MNEELRKFMSEVKIGAKQSHKNMTLYCLLVSDEAGVDFLTLDDALKSGALSVTEVNEGGTVPELKVINQSGEKVLLLDGEELVGAKQNRVLNVTILVAPKSETVIPVSCVEQGRWSYRSRRFDSESRAMSAKLRQQKEQGVRRNLQAAGLFASFQGEVWDGIEEKFHRMGAHSPTMAMADIYEAHQDSTQDYLKAFHPVENQIGMAVFIDGELAGIEILSKFDAFRKTHGKLIQSYVIDALETVGERTTGGRSSSKDKVTKLLEAVGEGRVEKRKSVALGDDVRVEADQVVGAGLEFDGLMLQMTIFLNDERQKDEGPIRNLARASRRRTTLRRP